MQFVSSLNQPVATWGMRTLRRKCQFLTCNFYFGVREKEKIENCCFGKLLKYHSFEIKILKNLIGYFKSNRRFQLDSLPNLTLPNLIHVYLENIPIQII